MKKGFPFPMNKTESIVGWIYVFVHTFALSYVVVLANIYLFPAMGFSLSTAHVNFLYYAISFVFLLCFLFKFLRSSFGYLCSNKLSTFTSVVLGYCIYMAALYAVSILLGFFMDDLVNPNSAAVTSQAKLNPNTMIAIAVLLAPVVEETLFRGVVFGTLQKSSRVLGYAVSAVFFAVYHLWEYMLSGFSWDLVLYLLQYIPAGLVLCWCYERSKNIWGPVFLHMIVNYVSITVTLG